MVAAPGGREGDAATVLLVEDEAPVRRLAERALQRRGFAVRAACSAEAALALLEDGTRPDLVVSDVMMPGMDGPALLSALRRRWPDLPVILVSGYAAQGARRALAEEEAIFLAKPYSLAALTEAVTQGLRRRATA
jgi:two-component system cell cycle sensor histidine kinase/response regulator CckA